MVVVGRPVGLRAALRVLWATDRLLHHLLPLLCLQLPVRVHPELRRTSRGALLDRHIRQCAIVECAGSVGGFMGSW